MWGPQVGIGSAAETAILLENEWREEGETEAAAVPATTTVKAKIRTMSFIIGYPFEVF
jgi:hypothetical protein